MRRPFLVSILFLGFILCFSQSGAPDLRNIRDMFREAAKLFAEAESLYAASGDDSLELARSTRLYRASRAEYEKVATLTSGGKWDSVYILASLQAALISYYIEENDSALHFYRNAFHAKNPGSGLSDSIYFVPYIYAGGIYHSRNQYDSALFLYRRADSIQSAYSRPLPESERLFNRLGALSYENGDFRQARNYFEKALERTNPGNTNLVANYRMNIASILIKLEQYAEASRQLEALLPLNVYANEIHHNLGIIHLHQNQPGEALEHLQKIQYGDGRKKLDLYYNFLMAYDHMGRKDSADAYYARAIEENRRWNGQRRNTSYGLLLKYRAEQFYRSSAYANALDLYQRAILQFHPGFHGEDPRAHPADFTEAYSYINLFHALIGKSRTFAKLGGAEPAQLQHALDGYESAYRLAHYVERTYNSEEARLFLNEIKYNYHNEPIDLALQLYESSQDDEYLEKAFLFDQRNKGSILSLHLQEGAILREATHPLITREESLRSELTRLTIRASSAVDSATQVQLADQIRDLEIELGKTRTALRSIPNIREQILPENIPGVKEIGRLLDPETALVSWHKSEDYLLALIIHRRGISHVRVPADTVLMQLINDFRNQLSYIDPAQGFGGDSLSVLLYRRIFKPLRESLNHTHRLIIIPDDELNFLPFEALRDDQGQYLLDAFSIQYQFSAQLLSPGHAVAKKEGLLAFAPFASRSFFSAGDTLDRLPATLPEIQELPGTLLVDSLATRERFLSEANRYGVLHLATHALVDNENPSLSFIAFYPGQREYKLFAREIYGLQLDSTELVVLSACETGTGKLVRGEGLMSLSRAFASAGCPNIVMSLWKAEDLVTSYIMRRFHHYRESGATLDAALRNAKRDLLRDNNMDPRLKSPNFWAHLLFIGEYESRQKGRFWPWVAGGIVVVLIAYRLARRRKK